MRVVKSISFNKADPYENKMISHFKQYPNFSNYVKRLIQKDMEGIATPFKQDMKTDENDNLMEMMI
ncbi:hypothetical protein BKP37_12615 [Anaerobacillus alkalilacustris]|uniref:Uncharacterized protein n=1 Tax=Anaerobacillus alkalilacustris TaxID=393763 RepID=A0A1S2LKC3_9BACI|nr:hypothetical protein [Anaerobacillus alkalilacustris]OIJ12640.1 hypothetical protein BKP37_12615 [Anaerobacillus alkalilacustris]